MIFLINCVYTHAGLELLEGLFVFFQIPIDAALYKNRFLPQTSIATLSG